MNARHSSSPRSTDPRRGSVLIIVLWICLGLVALTLYFANSMSSELRAADNRAAEAEARQAVAAGSRYAAYLLSQLATNGTMPDIQQYHCEAMPVGEGTFWFVGRDPNAVSGNSPTEPYFSLIDESSKLNLNANLTSDMIQSISHPAMTPDVADAIVAWKRANGQSSGLGDVGNMYARLDPPRMNKGGAYETVDELRLVYGVTLDLMFGEDTNRNGVLDPNEDDADASAPRDDHDGQLLFGLSEYFTVYSRLPTTRVGGGGARVNVSTFTNEQVRTRFRGILQQRGIDGGRISAILTRLGDTNNYASVAEFMVASGMNSDEFALIHADLTDGASPRRVNVNTASAAVLACIPGIGVENAESLVAYRAAHYDSLTSLYWLRDAGLSGDNLRRAGQYITDQTYQFSADIVGVGHNGRGYHRERVVFDTSTGIPRIIFRQDLTAYGWALGRETRLTLKGNKES